jgi:hypothetical protein
MRQLAIMVNMFMRFGGSSVCPSTYLISETAKRILMKIGLEFTLKFVVEFNFSPYQSNLSSINIIRVTKSRRLI